MGEINFEPTGNFAHITKFLILRKVLLILFPLYLHVDNTNINRKYSNKATTKNVHSFKTVNPNFTYKIAFVFYKIPTLWSSEVNKAILEQVKWRNRLVIICSNCLRKKTMCTKLIPEIVKPSISEVTLFENAPPWLGRGIPVSLS